MKGGETRYNRIVNKKIIKDREIHRLKILKEIEERKKMTAITFLQEGEYKDISTKTESELRNMIKKSNEKVEIVVAKHDIKRRISTYGDGIPRYIEIEYWTAYEPFINYVKQLNILYKKKKKGGNNKKKLTSRSKKKSKMSKKKSKKKSKRSKKKSKKKRKK